MNGAHTALRETSPDRPGHLSYRELLERLIEVERGPRQPVSFAPLGEALGQLDHAAAEQLIAEITPLTPLWREAKYEDSPLHCLAEFRTDEVTLRDFREAFEALQAAERRRSEILRQNARFFDIETPESLQHWLAEHEAALRALPPVVAQSLAQWAEILTPPAPDQPPLAEQLIPWLEHMDERMRILDRWTLEPVLYEKLAAHGTTPLHRLAAQAERLAHPPQSIFARLNPGRWIARRSLNEWLRSAGANSDAIDLSTLHVAAELELHLREERRNLQQWREALGDAVTSSPEPLPAMRTTVRRLRERLQPVVAAAGRVQACPLQSAAEELRHGGDPQACASVLDVCRASLALWAATRESETRLQSAAMWFDPAWISERRLSLAEHRPASDSMDQLTTAFPTLPAFQTFRLRARVLSRAAFPIFTLLRMRDEIWQRIATADLANEITRTLRREALLAWKFAAEKACPALLMERDELEQKVRLLSEKDAAMREANRRLLKKCSARVPIASRSRWDDVVMLTGQRSRRLREVVERGDPLGLFKLRPVWMVNPEMAGALGPRTLEPGAFRTANSRAEELLMIDPSSMPRTSSVPFYSVVDGSAPSSRGLREPNSWPRIAFPRQKRVGGMNVGVSGRLAPR